ncbi:MAG: lipopolysaccharide biosynthesis protein [Rhodospirillales bacterium]|nr:lipopolysaccharide biosynthesis protein [Rhodospirillales bacterium]
MDPQDTTLHGAVIVLKRRKWFFVLPVIAITVIGAIIAMVLPSVYRSQGTIMIEKPDIPPDLVASTITGYADERIQTIERRVMATSTLVDIIQKYNLYLDERQTTPSHELASEMRDNVVLELVSAELQQPRGNSTEATIAFNIGFDNEDPVVAQRVANELVSLYLSENVRLRQKSASETTEFLASEAAILERRISELERKLADLKQKHTGRLPEQMDYNMQLIERTEAELRSLDMREQALESRRIYLEGELMQTSPYGSYVVDGQRVMGPRDQLKALRTQLATLSGRYGSNHPDVQRLRREVAALEQQQPGGGASASSLRREAERVETELRRLRERYASDHPDVLRLERQLASLQGELADARSQPTTTPSESPDNPSYIALRSQIQAVQSELGSIAEQRARLKEKLEDYDKRIIETPLVEREYLQLLRDRESAELSYREIKNKQMQAHLGQSLETERKSERFTLLDPPVLPEKPQRPNRPLIVVVAFFVAAGAGAGIAFLAEKLDSAVYGARQVAELVGAAPLVTIPYIRTRAELWRATRRRVGVAVAFVCLLVGAITYVHFSVTPLDVLWAGVDNEATDAKQE